MEGVQISSSADVNQLQGQYHLERQDADSDSDDYDPANDDSFIEALCTHFRTDSLNAERPCGIMDSFLSQTSKRASIRLSALVHAPLRHTTTSIHTTAFDMERARSWASHFRRSDPRFRIMEYFNDVAKNGITQVGLQKGFSNAGVNPIVQMFNKAGVFTVWRPTSLDAIRHMMTGEGVGKGLNIKGKSAKKGKLSGFVPFLQIHDPDHTRQIRTLPKDSTMRIFYQSQQSRDDALGVVEIVGQEMCAEHLAARRVLLDPDASEEAEKEAISKFKIFELDDNPEIVLLDDYEEIGVFGLEIPERLFWEAYVMRQDITREKGSEYETGRLSEPAFQDMNFSSLRNHALQPSFNQPRPVVYQKDVNNAMEPRTLLMAYEEHGRVLPVVSDFDCFLVGTRGVTYSTPLPDEQVNLVDWFLSRIEHVLDEDSKDDDDDDNNLRESWTSRWLNVLKHNHINPHVPPCGFGDPRTYSVMEIAIERLKKDGCVRHGAECFNFYFPQELDEEFLVIGESINGSHWKYVDAEGLQDILLEKVKEGFTFPLNPKWVLCDPGWKRIYDALLQSNASNVQDSLNCWFPPEAGARERISEIFAKHPDGFRSSRHNGKNTNQSSCCERRLDGSEAADLAREQLIRHETLRRAKRKLLIVLRFLEAGVGRSATTGSACARSNKTTAHQTEEGNHEDEDEMFVKKQRSSVRKSILSASIAYSQEATEGKMMKKPSQRFHIRRSTSAV